MARSFTAFALSAACFVSLSACASTPKSSTLMTGISPADVSKTYAAGQMRSETDPVCVNFYNNAQAYMVKANTPNRGKNMLTSLGIGILASVATGGIGGMTSGIGQIAAQQTVSTAINQGGRLAINGMSDKSGPGKNIIKTATALSCPVNVTT